MKPRATVKPAGAAKKMSVAAKTPARTPVSRPAAGPIRTPGTAGRPGSSLPVPPSRTSDSGEYRDMLAGLIR